VDLLSNRWQYWFARALATTHLGSERARLAYRALADERDYYGFLAAERIGSEAQLNDSVHTLDAVQVNQLRRIPAVNRAVELYAVGDLLNARREWNRLVPQMDSSSQTHAAYLALQMGWTSQGIRIANVANLHDHLGLRFPVVYQEVFQRVSAITTVPHSFLIAIARQESAFDPRARSSANARGLMQLLHSTAGAAAKRAGLSAPSTTDLYNPAINVEISGHHLAALMARYGDRRPLVAAAYNAGQRRVDRWIKDASGTPTDVWIETIPFRETRNYVKNVLAFAQVYGQLLNSPIPMLQVHEATVP
jgi:soluble lytic murein transglycosylase